MFSILDTHPKPNMSELPNILITRTKELFHTSSSLGKDLIDVPISQTHDTEHVRNIVLGNLFLEQVAHRVNEDPSLTAPEQRL